MNLSISCQQTRKKSENGPTYEPRCRTFAKIIFIFAIQLFYGCQRNARKYITVTVSVRVSATVRVSVVWFSLICSFGGVKCRHLPAGRVYSIVHIINDSPRTPQFRRHPARIPHNVLPRISLFTNYPHSAPRILHDLPLSTFERSFNRWSATYRYHSAQVKEIPTFTVAKTKIQ